MSKNMFTFFKKNKQLNKNGICPICLELSKKQELIDGQTITTTIKENEYLMNLFGVEVCEGCYHDLINHMKYKNLNDLLDCDKKQLMLFLNKLAELKNNKGEK